MGLPGESFGGGRRVASLEMGCGNAFFEELLPSMLGHQILRAPITDPQTDLSTPMRPRPSQKGLLMPLPHKKALTGPLNSNILVPLPRRFLPFWDLFSLLIPWPHFAHGVYIVYFYGFALSFWSAGLFSCGAYD